MDNEVIEKALGAVLSGVVGSMIQKGWEPQRAFKLAAFVAIEGSLGKDAVIALGLPESTARRWRAQIRELKLIEVDERDLQAQILSQMLPLFGAPGLEVRKTD